MDINKIDEILDDLLWDKYEIEEARRRIINLIIEDNNYMIIWFQNGLIPELTKTIVDSGFAPESSDLLKQAKGICQEMREGINVITSCDQALNLAGVSGSLPTNEDITIEIVTRFLYNPHPNQRKNYNKEKIAFADGAKWMREKILGQ